MEESERREMFYVSPLAGTARWLGCFLAEKRLYSGQPSPFKTLHGDANYFAEEQPLDFYWLADYWKNPEAGALGRRIGRRKPWWMD